jgi:hypothetical protein
MAQVVECLASKHKALSSNPFLITVIISSLFSQPLETTNLLLSLWICLLWAFHMYGLIQPVAMMSSFFHLAK